MRRMDARDIIFVAALSMFAIPALAGGPVGEVATLDRPVKEFLNQALAGEVALPRDHASDEQIAIAIMQYVWQHKSEVRGGFPESQLVDLAICLLDRHGHSAGAIMNPSTRRLCSDRLLPLAN